MITRTWLKRMPRAFPVGLVAGLCSLASAMPSAASTWSTAQVDNTAAVGQFTALALDSNKKMHISYFDASGKLKYATDKSGTFAPSTLTASLVVQAATSITLDAASNPQVTHYYNDGTNSKGIRNIASSGSAWGTPSDPNGAPFIPSAELSTSVVHKGGFSHLVYTRGSLHYSTNSAAGNYTNWTRTQLDSTPDSGANSSVVVDAAGKVHVVGYNSASTDLFYYTNASGSWVKSTVATSTDIVGKWCSLAVDRSGNLHLSYLESSASPASYKIKYKVKPAGGTWQGEVEIGDAGSLGGYSSIAVDATGAAHVSYYYSDAASTGKLRYATNLGGSWQSEDADSSSNDLGSYSSIAVDESSSVYIAYYDGTNSSLKVATKKALRLSPESSGFGTVDRGFQSSPVTTVMVTNNLNSSQNLGPIRTEGANPGDFSVASDSCSNLQLPPDASCTVQLHFAPGSSAPRSAARSATLVIPTTAPYSLTFEAALTGTTSDRYLVTASAGAGGSITPTKVAVAPGGSQSFAVTPAAGFSVASVTADGTAQLTAPYTLSNIAADRTVYAALVSPIRILNSLLYYGSLQSAYGSMNQDWTIQSQQSIPAGDLLLDRDIFVTLSGGYDGTFASQPAQTEVQGNITISNGTLAVENLLFQ